MVTETKNPKLRVLVIDDSRDSCLLLTSLFEKLNCEVVTCLKSVEAAEIVAQQNSTGKPFQLVTIDIYMPELDGLGTAKQIREKGYKGGLVAFTAAASIQHKQQSLQSGIDAYFSKGVLKKELLAALVEQYGGTT